MWGQREKCERGECGDKGEGGTCEVLVHRSLTVYNF